MTDEQPDEQEPLGARPGSDELTPDQTAREIDDWCLEHDLDPETFHALIVVLPHAFDRAGQAAAVRFLVGLQESLQLNELGDPTEWPSSLVPVLDAILGSAQMTASPGSLFGRTDLKIDHPDVPDSD